MNLLFERIRADHVYTAPLENIDDLLQQLENKYQTSLPLALKDFYRSFSEVRFFDDRFRMMSVTEIEPVSMLQYGSPGWCAPQWLAVLDVWDSNYVAIDLDTSQMLDCYHEAGGTSQIIARDFKEFLERLLDSQGELYWLDEKFQAYGEATYEPPAEFYRQLDQNWWAKLGDEIGPETCSTDSCQRKRLALSVKCRRHHYEMIMNRECPFDE